MTNPNVLYKVTGRYMDGQKLIGYHLVGEDGSQSRESKDRIIFLIGKGIITNMRIQRGSDNEIILRGKGVNLNKLPVYDTVKNKYRNNSISQHVASSGVSVDKSSVDGISQMGQFTITKRILFKNKCLGYEVVDYSGAVRRINRETLIKMGRERLISNAIVQQCLDKSGNTRIIVRGVKCDLNKLPVLIVNSSGKIIDPTKEADKISVRIAYMRHSGIIHDTTNNKVITFKAGEFIACGVNGRIDIKTRQDIENNYTLDTEHNTAICDNFTSVISGYFIESFGGKTIKLTPNMVKSWKIFKPKSKKQ